MLFLAFTVPYYRFSPTAPTAFSLFFPGREGIEASSLKLVPQMGQSQQTVLLRASPPRSGWEKCRERPLPSKGLRELELANRAEGGYLGVSPYRPPHLCYSPSLLIPSTNTHTQQGQPSFNPVPAAPSCSPSCSPPFQALP